MRKKERQKQGGGHHALHSFVCLRRRSQANQSKTSSCFLLLLISPLPLLRSAHRQSLTPPCSSSLSPRGFGPCRANGGSFLFFVLLVVRVFFFFWFRRFGGGQDPGGGGGRWSSAGGDDDEGEGRRGGQAVLRAVEDAAALRILLRPRHALHGSVRLSPSPSSPLSPVAAADLAVRFPCYGGRVKKVVSGWSLVDSPLVFDQSEINPSFFLRSTRLRFGVWKEKLSNHSQWRFGLLEKNLACQDLFFSSSGVHGDLGFWSWWKDRLFFFKNGRSRFDVDWCRCSLLLYLLVRVWLGDA